MSDGQFAIIDECDYAAVSAFDWYPFFDDHTCYATTDVTFSDGITERNTSLHRFIMGFRRGDGRKVDHINCNGLHNFRDNLRECNDVQNACNRRKRRGCKSKFKGVHWYTDTNSWRARIQVNGKRKLIGDFKDETIAAKAYDQKAIELHGSFARLNFPKEPNGKTCLPPQENQGALFS